jgi:hypothetical protein
LRKDAAFEEGIGYWIRIDKSKPSVRWRTDASTVRVHAQ